ncbi:MULTISPECIES: isochorismatase family protein [Kordiimonas]|jgi:nicotinamidase-related amidase|uniref:isochorismatase family protein n=1 Tax=Kordiimonas TaxID=288021 RepID=UPI00257E6C03|nr:isochorismatase family protein [Kordiimonas sp. UBA4487]
MNHDSDIYRILMRPEETALVIVDHQEAFASCFEAEAITAIETGIAALAEAAGSAGIPIIVSMVETNSIAPGILPSLRDALRGAAEVKRTGFNPWEEKAFLSAIKTANRERLVIAGLSSETSLSFTALCGLEEGFDIYVVRDACLGYSEDSITMTFSRLTQAGAVPVSWRQAVFEWCQGTVEPEQIRKVLKPVTSLPVR